MVKIRFSRQINREIIALSCLWATLLLPFVKAQAVSFFSDVPLLYQLRVFRSELDPNHYVILGNDGIYADAGNWFVLDWRDGVMMTPKLSPDSRYGNGGFDFKFKSGQWLHIPVHSAALGATHEILPAGLIDPNRGREPLEEVAITRGLISKLGMTTIVASTVLKGFDNEGYVESATQAPKNEDIVLLTIQYDRNIKKAPGFRDLSASLSEDPILVEDISGTKPTLYILAFKSQVELIDRWARDELKAAPIVRRRIVESAAREVPFADIATFYEAEMVQALPSIAATFGQIEGSIQKMNLAEADKTAGTIFSYLHRLDEGILEIISRGLSRLSRFEGSAGAQAQLTENFVNPIKSIMQRGYEILHRINTPTAREILLFSGRDYETRISLINQLTGVGSETYFQTWVKLLKERVEWVNTLTPEQRITMRVRQSQGGTFGQLAFLNVTLKDYDARREGPLLNLNGPKNMFPLLVFGLGDCSLCRAELVQAIIEMDKSAERAAASLRTQHDGEIVGSLTLQNVLNGLVYAAADPATESLPGFSRTRYYVQAMQIVSELLNTSRITIENSATYLGLLNTAFSLQTLVAEEFGVVPNERANTPDLNDLTRELMGLHRAMQVRLARSVYIGAAEAIAGGSDCLAILRRLYLKPM